MFVTTAISSKMECVLKVLPVRLMPSATLKATVSVMMDSMITMECAQSVLLGLFIAHQPPGASMYAVKTLPSLSVLVVVSVTLGLVWSTRFVSSVLPTTLLAADTV